MKLEISELATKLPLPANEKFKNGVWDIEAFRQGNVSLIYYAPKDEDFQTFHDEEEFYFIASGTAELIVGDEKFDCKIGDALFVPAKKTHKFVNFSDDFATWAVFF